MNMNSKLNFWILIFYVDIDVCWVTSIAGLGAKHFYSFKQSSVVFE